MDPRTLDWFDTLSTALLWAGVAVLGLSLIGAIAIAGSESSIPGFDELQRENRGVLSIAAVGGGLTSAGLLAGIGALLRLRVAEHRERATFQPGPNPAARYPDPRPDLEARDPKSG